eukprot:TRINITY_DN3238_c0_g1_i1.p1 TRINITY_DN3238_c0_g1~~TRINITY_DN3238_c0_g1_i1.p1  ORF type:complete len:375 (-),score=97.19 TRINITY_DN3238_c0_g1_i1:64-1095(-)
MLTAEEADVVGAEACDERPSYLLRSHWRRLRPPQPPPLLSRQSANAVGAAAAATLAPTGDVAALVACLAGLQGELRAYLFFFLEARYLAYVATTCLSLYRALWDDVVFWSAYAGPCLAAPCKLSRASPVESFQDAFRKWMFHLDEDWPRHFKAYVAEEQRRAFGADRLRLLQDADRLVSGLRPDDAAPDLELFVDALVQILDGDATSASASTAAADASQLDEKRAAEALAGRVERVHDVFSEVQRHRIAVAYERRMALSVPACLGEADGFDLGSDLLAGASAWLDGGLLGGAGGEAMRGAESDEDEHGAGRPAAPPVDALLGWASAGGDAAADESFWRPRDDG